MYNKVVELLIKEREFVQDNQRIREKNNAKDNEAFINYAKINTVKFNTLMFTSILNAYIEGVKDKEKRIKNDQIKYERDQYQITSWVSSYQAGYEYVMYPDEIDWPRNLKTQNNSSYKPLYNYKQGNKKVLELALEYNRTHEKNPIVFCLFDDTVLPVIYNKDIYEKLGMNFFSDMNVGLTGYIEFKKLKKVIISLDHDLYTKCPLVNKDIVNKAHDVLSLLANRETISTKFDERCKRNINALSLYLIKNFIEAYRYCSDVEYNVDLSYIEKDEDIESWIGKNELKKLNNYRTCSLDYPISICYIGYTKDGKNNETYIPVNKKQLEIMAEELGLNLIIDAENNSINISTNLTKFEELVTKTYNEKAQSSKR